MLCSACRQEGLAMRSGAINVVLRTRRTLLWPLGSDGVPQPGHPSQAKQLPRGIRSSTGRPAGASPHPVLRTSRRRHSSRRPHTRSRASWSLSSSKAKRCCCCARSARRCSDGQGGQGCGGRGGTCMGLWMLRRRPQRQRCLPRQESQRWPGGTNQTWRQVIRWQSSMSHTQAYCTRKISPSTAPSSAAAQARALAPRRAGPAPAPPLPPPATPSRATPPEPPAPC